MYFQFCQDRSTGIKQFLHKVMCELKLLNNLHASTPPHKQRQYVMWSGKFSTLVIAVKTVNFTFCKLEYRFVLYRSLLCKKCQKIMSIFQMKLLSVSDNLTLRMALCIFEAVLFHLLTFNFCHFTRTSIFNTVWYKSYAWLPSKLSGN